MYFMRIDERDFAAKPMNCPSHCLMFRADKHSYRELPLRLADFGRLHRYERAGAVHGLTRVRTFCQDDAHIFCTIDQLQGEIENFVSMLNEIYRTLGMQEYRIYLSTRPEKRVGSGEVWDRAEGALQKALTTLSLPFTLNPGDGAFYGPKLDIMFVDALKRPWQLGTLQVDFNLPELFQLKYTGEDNSDHRPVMLHRAVLGSLERFIGVYLEHTAGRLPTWLSPLQVVVLNVTDRVNTYCGEILKRLKEVGCRAEFDDRKEKLNFKIREAQLKQIPYMIIIGDKEMETDQVSVRLRDGRMIQGLSQPQMIRMINSDRLSRQLDPGPEEGRNVASNLASMSSGSSTVS
ncbi:MAG: threonine--tRNA ligase, partial [Bdellovibrio sp.]